VSAVYVDARGWVWERLFDGDYDEFRAKSVASLPAACPGCGGAFDLEDWGGEEWFGDLGEEGFSTAVGCVNAESTGDGGECRHPTYWFEVTKRRLVSLPVEDGEGS
jgi:hypothetical protein